MKDQTVNVLGFVGHTISVTITQLCFCHVINSPREYVNKQMWLCLNKTLFLTSNGMQDFVPRAVALLIIPIYNYDIVI